MSIVDWQDLDAVATKANVCAAPREPTDAFADWKAPIARDPNSMHDAEGGQTSPCLVQAPSEAADVGGFLSLHPRTAACGERRLFDISPLSRTAPRPDWFEQCEGEVKRLRNLEHDWDSYGAAAPNDAAIALASRVLRALQDVGVAAPRIGPSAEEGVCISYRMGGLYADIECFNSGEIVAATVDATGAQQVWEVGSDSQDIRRTARRIRAHLDSHNP